MIILFLILYLNVKKLKLIKNESYNLLTIKVINFFNCSKSAFNINLQNVIIDLIKYENSVENAIGNLSDTLSELNLTENNQSIENQNEEVSNKNN